MIQKNVFGGGKRDLLYIIIGFLVNVLLLVLLFRYSIFAGVAYLFAWFLVAAYIVWRYRVVLLGGTM